MDRFGSSALLLVATGVAAATVARAGDFEYPPSAAALSAASLAAWAVPSDLVSVKECRWCRENGFDRFFQGSSRSPRKGADLASWGTAVAEIGVALYAVRSSDGDAFGPRAGVVLNSGGAAAIVTQVAKYAFRRARPYTHADGADPSCGKADNCLSFFSGHTSITVALAVSAFTVNDLSGQHGHKPEEWTAAGLAALTGVLRIRANKHYATDVLTGAACGWLVGRTVPRWFHDASGSSSHPPAAFVPPPAVPVAGGRMSASRDHTSWTLSAGRSSVAMNLHW